MIRRIRSWLPVRVLMCCKDDLDAKIVEGSWRTMGMRGSGSNDIVMNDVLAKVVTLFE